MTRVADAMAGLPVTATLEGILAELCTRRRTPLATYRLQMHKGFTFSDAVTILPYLAKLGITDCYTSPILMAKPGSTHGYDITDHNRLNPELGTEADYARFTATLTETGMGHLLDFVPNHMGIDPDTNLWWRDVLENGPSSKYANTFDIDWAPAKPEMKNKVLLPILSDRYGIVLERGDLKLVFDRGTLHLRYGAMTLPIHARDIARVLNHHMEALEQEGAGAMDIREYMSILAELSNLPSLSERDAKRIAERDREKEVARDRLLKLVGVSPRIERHIQQAVTHFNGTPGDPASFDALSRLLDDQAYRLAYWRTAAQEINYRRFFEVDSLAGIRVESREVFEATHRLVLQWIATGRVLGLRLDHVDGLYDPAGYFETLQNAFLQEWVKTRWTQSGQSVQDLPADWRERIQDWRVAERKKNPTAVSSAPGGLAARPLYLSAEKILSGDETLDPHWMIDGTSGYDYLNQLNGLFIDPRSAPRLAEIYARFLGESPAFPVILHDAKKLIMSTTMASELNVLATALNRISEADRSTRDFTLGALRDALRELVAAFPVYRTYINTSRASQWDRDVIGQAVEKAKRFATDMEPSIFDFIRDVLVPANAEKVAAREFQRQLHFAMSFQQYSGPVQAKGLEDTTFYRYSPLLSVNEVGGDPSRFGTDIQQFHETNSRRLRDWPDAMLATATHDTKRGEDARARLNVLSEIPEEWEEQTKMWAKFNDPHRTLVEGDWAPDRHDEYFYYQSLLGAWPASPAEEGREDFKKRMSAFMAKAIKESRRHTSWVHSHEEYEKAVANFVDATLSPERAGRFLNTFKPFARRVAKAGVTNSLSQLVLKIACPGVCDIYQGTELWDLSLVDPDNRRPVHYADRIRILADLDTAPQTPTEINDLLENWPDGRIKLWTLAQALRFRKAHRDLLLTGAYTPLVTEGEAAEHVVAFARETADEKLLVIVPRFTTHVPDWKTTAIVLPPSWSDAAFTHAFTGESAKTTPAGGRRTLLPLSEVWKTLPFGWLIPTR